MRWRTAVSSMHGPVWFNDCLQLLPRRDLELPIVAATHIFTFSPIVHLSRASGVPRRAELAIIVARPRSYSPHS